MTEKGKTLRQVNADKKRKKIRNTLVSLAVIAAILVVGFWMCFTKLFLIKKCVVKGDVPYTEDEVLKGAGLEYGMNLYELPESKIKDNIVYNLPYIDSIIVKHRWPSTIVFDTVPAVPSMYVTVSGDMFVLSQSLRVLSQTNDIDYIESHKLLDVVIGGIKSCVAGEYLETEGDMNETVKTIYKFLEDNELIADTTQLDLSDKFNITFIYKKAYTVKLGDSKNLDLKIRFMKAIIEKLTPGGSGIIDVSDENAKEGIVKSY